MKTKVAIIAFIVFSTIASASTNINEVATKSENVFMDCSGEFNIDGKSYTITLHDVSLWTCIKFKVASWFY